MKYAIDSKDRVCIKCGYKDGVAFIDNGKGTIFEQKLVSVDSLLLAMIFQTLRGRLRAWADKSDDFCIQMDIHEMID